MNSTPANPGAYEAKKRDYFEYERPEMLGFIPREAKRVLDVGCGTGGFGVAVKKLAGAEVWGIEPDAAAAKEAEGRLDRAINGLFNAGIDLPAGYFDCVIFNDVIEHMYAPKEALELARRFLSPGGRVVASIPNVRYFPNLWRLLIDGEWEYAERGILDETHIRFFTRRSIERMFQAAGYAIERIEGINAFCEVFPGERRLWRYYKLISWIPMPGISEMRYLQIAVVAKGRK
jgi:SAM-dependent methyltransferase